MTDIFNVTRFAVRSALADGQKYGMKVTSALDRVDCRVVGGSHIATSLVTWSARAPQLWLFESKLRDESNRRNQ